jgi:hypothetical protein
VGPRLGVLERAREARSSHRLPLHVVVGGGKPDKQPTFVTTTDSAVPATTLSMLQTMFRHRGEEISVAQSKSCALPSDGPSSRGKFGSAGSG